MMKKATLNLILIIFVLFVVASVFNNDDDESTITEEIEPAVLAEPLTFEDQVFQDLKEEGINDVLGVSIDTDSDYLIVKISPGYTSDHGLFQRTVSRTTFQIMETVVSNEYNVYGVMVYAETSLMNNKGNEVQVDAYIFQTTLDDAKTVNWNNLRWSDDPLRYAEANAEYFYLNPALV